MEVYFDNAATTKIIPEVRDIMLETLDNDYGNPSSVHTKGVDAEKYLKYAREVMSSNMKCSPKEIIFTSGGTEANNMAVMGLTYANKRSGNRIITTTSADGKPAGSKPCSGCIFCRSGIISPMKAWRMQSTTAMPCASSCIWTS